MWLTPPAKPTLSHYLVPFIPPSTRAVGQCSAGVQGGGFRQDGNMMTHQSPGEKNPPPRQDMCHGPAFFVGFLLPPATTIKPPSAGGTPIPLPLNSGPFFVRRADRVPLVTPLCSTVAAGKKVPLFSGEMQWKHNSLLLFQSLGLCPPPPVKTAFL